MKLRKLLVAFLVVLTTISMAMAVVACGKKPVEESSSSQVEVVEPGPETGVYYYDTGDEEYQLVLYEATKVNFLTGATSKSGTYTANENMLNIVLGEGESISAKYENDEIALTYQNMQMRFVRKIYYTVTFDVKGGSAIDPQRVLNGKTVSAPEATVKEGYQFIGWYVDDKYTTPFIFNSQVIKADTTLYAYWGEKAFGQSEYTVNFDLNYEGNGPDAVETIGGRVYQLPEVTREGYAFDGWWMSADNDGAKLTSRYTTDVVLNENTTLYALWAKEDGKLATPSASVDGTHVYWNAVKGAMNYQVKVTNGEGTVVVDQTVSVNELVVDFANMGAGEYKVEVTANSSDAKSQTAVRYYKNKALARVSVFNVVEPSGLVFNKVEGADHYYVTIDCGNKAHNHTKVSLGNSTYYNFANCEMQEGGIKFVVIAEGKGMVPSVSETFVYNRQLAKIDKFAMDEENEVLSWNPVADASGYVVSVLAGNASEPYVEEIGNNTSYSLKEFAARDGGIVVNVYPKTKGYNSPAPAEYKYNKVKLATPTGVKLVGNMLTWEAVEGAKEYNVMVGSKKYTAKGTEFDLSTLEEDVNAGYAVVVRAVAQGKNSSWSNPVDIKNYFMESSLAYKDGMVTWNAVFGADYYEVKVNNGKVQVVNDAYMAVNFTEKGENVVYVRSVDGEVKGDWANVSVYTYMVTYDLRGGQGAENVFKAFGDSIAVPQEVTKTGYDFGGWYNTPAGPDANGLKYDDKVFEENGDVVLYAYWNPKKYVVTYNPMDNGVVEGEVASKTVTYQKDYVLDVAVPNDTSYMFKGWFSAPGGSGVQFTDEYGVNINPYHVADDCVVYACWRKVFSFVETTSKTGEASYAVQKGVDIELVDSVRVPVTHNGKMVTNIYSGAFNDCKSLKVIEVPDTIETIGATTDSTSKGPFSGCTNLEAVNVYKVEGDHTVKYSSSDGVLINNDEVTGTVRLNYVPSAKTGSLAIPQGVTELPLKVFAGSKIEEVIIPSSVQFIRQTAFYNCRNLKSVVFESDNVAEGFELQIENKVFQNCSSLENIVLPKHLAQLPASTTDNNVTDIFYNCLKLNNINVEQGNKYYSSVEGMLCDAEGATLLYCPVGRRGAVRIPEGVQAIGAYAFERRTYITEVTIPDYVTNIGKSAFENCFYITKVTFEGTAAPTEMVVEQNAFYNCRELRNVTFEEQCNVVALGDSAFGLCRNLPAISIPASMKTVGNKTFEGCLALASVSFAEGGESMTFGESTFAECISLKKIVLPSSLNNIAMKTFDGCESLEAVEVSPDNQYYCAVDGVLFDKNQTAIYFYPTLKGNYVLPETVKTIGAGAFANNLNMTTITIGKNVTEIQEGAFKRCLMLGEIIFEQGGTEDLVLGTGAFSDCVEVRKVVLPDRLKTISESAFENAVTLNDVTFGAQLTEIGANAFANTGLTAVVVPETVTTIGKKAFDGCLDLAEVTLSKGTGKVEGEIFSNCPSLAKVVIPEGITEIDNYAFYNCTELAEINIPSTVTRIGDGAFSNCSSLTAVVIPNAVTYIGGGAFYKCTELKSVTFEKGGTQPLVIDNQKKEKPASAGGWSSDAGVFHYCKQLTSVELPARTTQIGEWAFYNCDILESLTFEKGVTFEDGSTSLLKTIGERAFVGVSTLKTLELPEGLEKIGEWAFHITSSRAKCDLTTVTIPSTVTLIEEGAFGGQRSLAEVKFVSGANPLTIVDEAFEDCPLTEVTLPANLAEISQTAFSGCNNLATVNVAEGGQVYNSLDGILYKGEEVVLLPAGKTGTLTLKEGMTVVSYNMFYGSNLSEVVLPASLETIGQNAFAYSAIETITIPANVKEIYSYAFKGCSKLKTVTFAEGSKLTTIGMHAFEKSGLTSIKLPASVTELGHNFSTSRPAIIGYVFAECTALTTVEFEEGFTLTEIPARTFYKAGIKEFVVPDGMTKIGDNAFESSKLVSVTIPASVNLVAENAFKKCSYLKTVNFLENTDPAKEATLVLEGASSLASSTTSANSAFSNCTALETITLPAHLTEIGNMTFAGCTKLREVNFAEGCTLEVLGDKAFWKTAIEKIVIPNDVSKIGKTTNATSTSVGTFLDCAKLKSITLPAALTQFNWNRFLGCKALEEILVDEGSYNFASKDGVLYNKDFTTLIYYPNNKLDVTYTIPDTVTTIEGYAFGQNSSNYSKVKELVVPASVETISERAFYYGKNLTTITFAANSNLKEIGKEAFYYANIGEIVLPENLAEIGNYAFKYCKQLQKVTLPQNLTKLGDYAFNGCEKIEELKLPESLTTIGRNVFDGCKGLVSVTLPQNMKAIPASMFSYCKALTSVAIPAGVTEIGDYAFRGCEVLAEITIPEGVTKIGRYVFNSCKLIESVVIPEAFKGALPDNMFYGCENLKEVTLPSGITKIGMNTFKGCANLTTVNIPYGVTEIANSAFEGCEVLNAVDLPHSVTKIGNRAFYGCAGITTFVINEEVTEIGTDVFTGIPSIAITVAQGNADYVMDSNVLMNADGTKILYIPQNLTGEYVIPERVTEIGTNAFMGSKITKVVIPDGVTVIAASAFQDCAELQEVVLPDGLVEIKDKAFMNCTKLASVTLGSKVTKIGSDVFAGCTALETVTIGNGNEVLTLGTRAFKDCTALKEITFPRRLRNRESKNKFTGAIISLTPGIGTSCFENCTSLATVTFENNGAWLLTEKLSMGDSAFKNCSALTAFNLPRYAGTRVVSLGYYSTYYRVVGQNAFEGCTSLKTFTFDLTGKNSEYVGKEAFKGCTSLEEIDLPENIYLGGNYASSYMFEGCTSLKRASVCAAGWTASVFGLFKGCTALTTVEILGGAYSWGYIGPNSFEGCTSLTNVIMPNNIKEIYPSAFVGCTALKEITLPRGFQELGKNVFEGCTALTTVNIDTLEQIGDGAFKGCTAITSITLPATVKTVGANVFDGWTETQTINVELVEAPAGWNAAWNGNCLAVVNWKTDAQPDPDPNPQPDPDPEPDPGPGFIVA